MVSPPERRRRHAAIPTLQSAVDEAAVSKVARQRDKRGADALAALEREAQRGTLLAVIRYQMQAQIRHAPLGHRLRSFLRQPWVEVIVQAMVLHGRESRQAQAWIDLVDALFASLQPISSHAEGQVLRARLPGLIDGLRRGAASIALPATVLEPALHELMEQHERVLRGQPVRVAPDTMADPDMPVARRPADEKTRASSQQMPTIWAEAAVDRASLPTVRAPLHDSADSPQARAAIREWIDAQRAGTWYHLFVQGSWLTAQLAWVAENQSCFHFVGQDGAERHSLARGALERLLPAGLIAVLGGDTIVVKAADSLMQNLPDAKA